MQVLGIDLGTTTTEVVKFDDFGTLSLLSEPLTGKRIVPSAIAESPNRDGAYVVGEAAKFALSPFVEFKRQMEYGPLEDFEGSSMNPMQLSALVLAHTLTFVGVSGIRDVMVTVPAQFSNKGRTATIAAALSVEMNVIGLINEPTAAMIYYLHKNPGDGKYMVFDLGGGTLDVSVAEVEGGKIGILTSHGDVSLGGKDFDDVIERIVIERCHGDYGYSVPEDFDFSQGVTPPPEEIKRNLSNINHARAIVHLEEDLVRLDITRDEFEKASEELVERMKDIVEEVLDSLEMEKSEFKKILLVGGATRMPMISRMLFQYFGFAPESFENPDEVVAYGAALYGAYRVEKEHGLNNLQKNALRGLSITDVANHNFGTMCLDDSIGEEVNSIIIEKNSPLPVEVRKTYFTAYKGQTEVTCEVTQSLHSGHDLEAVEILWSGSLDNLPPDRPEGRAIDISYSYDESQVMHCTFVDVETSLTLHKSISFSDLEDDDLMASADISGIEVQH